MFLYGLSLAPGLTGRTAGVEVKLSSHGGAGGGFNSHSSGARATVHPFYRQDSDALACSARLKSMRCSYPNKYKGSKHS